MQSYKSLWVPTGELLLDKIFQHNTTHALNNSIGLTFWQEIDSTFPNEHGIKAIWTGVERFNATHFSERFYHMAKVYLLELNDLIRRRASNATLNVGDSCHQQISSSTSVSNINVTDKQ